MCIRRMPKSYTFTVLYDTRCDMSTQEYCNVAEDAGVGEMLNHAQKEINACNPD